MFLTVLKWVMFVVAGLLTADVFAGGRAGSAELAAGLWISFTMIHLYQRRFPEEEKESFKSGGK